MSLGIFDVWKYALWIQQFCSGFQQQFFFLVEGQPEMSKQYRSTQSLTILCKWTFGKYDYKSKTGYTKWVFINLLYFFISATSSVVSNFSHPPALLQFQENLKNVSYSFSMGWSLWKCIGSVIEYSLLICLFASGLGKYNLKRIALHTIMTTMTQSTKY